MKILLCPIATLCTIFISAQEKDTVKYQNIQAVTLQGTNNFRTPKSESVARIPLKNLENPTVYNVVPKELISETVANDINTALSSAPGVLSNNSLNENGNAVFLRGFNSEINFRNGLPQNPRVQPDVANLERIEVVKGPAGTLFGGVLATYGGVVNLVTKKPREDFGGLVSYTFGSWNMHRVTADINTPLNRQKTSLARFNFSGFTQNSFQDQGFSKGLSFTGAFTYKFSDNTRLNLDFEYFQPKRTLNGFIRDSEIITTKSMKDYEDVYYRSFTGNDIATKRSNTVTSAELEHTFNERWKSKTSFQYAKANERDSNFMVLFYVDDNTVSRNIRPFDHHSHTTYDVQQNFFGDFHIGSVRNRMVAGVDYFAEKILSQYGTWQYPGRPKGFVFAQYDEVTLDADAVWEPVTKDRINQFVRVADNNDIRRFNTLSAYVSDVISPIPTLHLMASLRTDFYTLKNSDYNGESAEDGYKQTQLSPKFGLVYEIVPNQISFFSNYVNGFKNYAPSENQDGVITKWKPEQGNQFEAGFKMDLFNKKLLTTLSYYVLNIKNRLIDDNAGLGSRQDAGIKNHGLEVDIIANPVLGWNIVFGYGYNENHYDEQSMYNGRPMEFAPKNIMNLWTSYKVPHGRLEGLGAGVGVNCVSKAYLNIENYFEAPGYTTVSETLFYDKPKYRIALKVNNLFNQKYWNYYGQPQKPREIVANISYKF